MTRTRVGIVVAVVGLVFGLHAPVDAAKPQPKGTFGTAGFSPPDFSDGESATVPLRESRKFTATCTCARQPGTAPCSGSVELQIDDGGGWDWFGSDGCSADEGQSCSSVFSNVFDVAGTFRFRVFCDESDGTDALQGPTRVVTITVEDTTPACSDGATRACPLQLGVCAGSQQICQNGEWLPCNYGPRFEDPEATCFDGRDNDCDGRVDYVDGDGDGIPLCGGQGVINEVLLTDSNGDNASIQILEFRNGVYEESWGTRSGDVSQSSGGGEMGDLTGDGIPEFALQRIVGSSANKIEVWSFLPSLNEWYRLWSSPTDPGYSLKVNEILDADGDGLNELLITDRTNGILALYNFDATGLTGSRTVQNCADPVFHATAADLDGNGLPEIFFQCHRPEDIEVHEYNPGTGVFKLLASVPAPYTYLFDSGQPMVVDDMEAGDVNGDGVPDIVFCGNSAKAHVLTLTGKGYEVIYDSPGPAVANSQFTQTCSVGDMTNNGVDDILVINKEGAKVYSFQGGSFVEVWAGPYPTTTPSIGASFVGDADNDGFTEFVFGDQANGLNRLYENDEEGAGSFFNTTNFGPMVYGGGSIIIGNLNPTNDQPPVDCDDTNPFKGIYEICGDLIDNDCNGTVDNGCDFSFCGDNVCDGADEGESCTTCADDCGCLGPGCKHGCCGDGVCGRRETSSNCPVDCS